MVERNLLLFTIVMMEEIQSKPVVCAQFFLWNILGLLRYAEHSLLTSGNVCLHLLDNCFEKSVFIQPTGNFVLYRGFL